MWKDVLWISAGAILGANLRYAVSKLADRMSHLRLLGAGLLVLIGADIALAMAQGLTAVAVEVALWGLHMGMTQGVLATM